MSCARDGYCAAGGYYTDEPYDYTDVFAATASNGVWGTAVGWDGGLASTPAVAMSPNIWCTQISSNPRAGDGPGNLVPVVEVDAATVLFAHPAGDPGAVLGGSGDNR